MLRSKGGGSPRLTLPMLAVCALALAGCKADLYTKLEEREANEMLALLLDEGVSASRIVSKDGTSTLQVEESQLARAIELLKAEGLPRPTFKNMGEVFKGSGLIASPTEERARYVYALSEELSRTISDIDGVLSARIHVVLPKNDLLRQDTTPSSASVFIRHDSRAALNTLLPQIKMLVANSIEGLSYDKVSVTFVPVERAAPVHERPAPAAASPMDWPIEWVAGLVAIAAILSAALGAFVFARLQGRRRPPAPKASPGAIDASAPGVLTPPVRRETAIRKVA